MQQEAEKRDVKVSDAEVKKSFEDQKKQAFPKEADYKKFLELGRTRRTSSIASSSTSSRTS